MPSTSIEPAIIVPVIGTSSETDTEAYAGTNKIVRPMMATASRMIAKAEVQLVGMIMSAVMQTAVHAACNVQPAIEVAE